MQLFACFSFPIAIIAGIYKACGVSLIRPIQLDMIGLSQHVIHIMTHNSRPIRAHSLCSVLGTSCNLFDGMQSYLF